MILRGADTACARD